MLDAEFVRFARWVQWIADEDERGRREAFGDSYRAHAPTHRPAPESDPAGRHTEVVRQAPRGGDDTGHEHTLAVRRPPAGETVREVDALDR